jgi:hypothetical protein
LFSGNVAISWKEISVAKLRMDGGSTEGRISGVRGVICSLVVSVIATQKVLQIN